jgi:two-component system, OmpR family, phosphate regulon sensor histidine kinase PhoR
MRASFFWRLYVPVVGLLLISTLAAGAWIERDVRRHMALDLEDSLRARAALLAELAERDLDVEGQGTAPSLQSRLVALRREGDARLTVVRRDGAVAADSEKDPATMSNHLQRPEIQLAREHGEGLSERSSETTGVPYLYYARRIGPAGAEIGYARAAFPLDSIERRIASLRATVGGTGLAAVALAAAIALYFARRISAPLSRMTEVAEQIARGERSDVERIEGPDEIVRLSDAMRSMNDQLEERLSTITSDHNKLAAILSSMVEGLIAVDRDERVVHLNAAAARMLDVDPREAVGRRIWETTRVVAVSEILEAARSSAGEERRECRVTPAQAGRAEVALELRASPLYDHGGQLAGVVCMLHDVSALRKLETMRRDFVANVSHELKTPLTAIRGMVETVIEDPEMPRETERRFLDRVREQSLRLSALVTDLLTLARVESNEGRLELAPVDVVALAREAARRIGEACAASGLGFSAELPGGPEVLDSDEEALRQILDNLLDNARKYTPRGGRVTLRVASEAGETRLEVSDTGIGIAPEDQERVFERFYRVDKARSRELGGTGLGLSIVKHLAQSLGGRVSLTSELGRGSTFRVHLPRRSAGVPRT